MDTCGENAPQYNHIYAAAAQKNGAEGETRTPTGILRLDPEPSASTSSATSARWKTKKTERIALLKELVYIYRLFVLVKLIL